MIMVNYILKANIQMEQNMEKENNIMKMVIQFLKVNLKMKKNGKEKAKNIMIMVKYCLKENI